MLRFNFNTKTALAMLAVMMLSTGISFGQGKIKVFTEDEKDTKKNVGTKGSFRKGDLNQIKFNVWQVGRGVMGLNYERILNDKFSVEGGLGVTVFNDYLFELSTMNMDALDNGGDFVKKTSGGMGPALSIAGSFWPKGSKDFDGTYLKAQLSYRSYNLGTSDYQTNKPGNYVIVDPVTGSGYYQSLPYNNGYSFVDFGLMFGQQGEMMESSFIRDAYIGFGFRMANYSKITEKTVGGSTEDVVDRVSKILPRFYLGYAIGLPF